MLVSSHLLAEVDQMCSHVGVMFEGKLRRAGADRRARPDQRRTVRVDTDRTADAARVLTELGLTAVDIGADRNVTALLGEVAVE